MVQQGRTGTRGRVVPDFEAIRKFKRDSLFSVRDKDDCMDAVSRAGIVNLFRSASGAWACYGILPSSAVTTSIAILISQPVAAL